eukprot:CAMPEP_0172879046 /NCGR_PEP_ID=MMETSP1075-20121228/111352_1 /TAXON_ID=2916 /ORGANISM="Ceratium fusus, Strain PA161109" /LENGTH=89 /DNA_ID=CAMNT_0013730971 /DNA_START=55 /DNA_END=324 /DNA_ORIENTATION=-
MTETAEFEQCQRSIHDAVATTSERSRTCLTQDGQALGQTKIASPETIRSQPASGECVAQTAQRVPLWWCVRTSLRHAVQPGPHPCRLLK